MPLLLALETATDVCSVALARGGDVVVEMTLARPRTHAENLVPLVRDALRYGGTALADLDAVAVSMGPGSYTGLRIGVSTAKGLAMAGKVALVGVPSLEALAAAAAPLIGSDDVLLPAFTSRWHEVYAAAFRKGAEGSLETVRDAAAVPAAEVLPWLGDLPTPRLWLLGGGAPRIVPALEEGPWPFTQVPLAEVAPAARWVARLGRDRLQHQQTEDLAAFEPFYLKTFVAKKQRSAFEKLTF